MHLRPRIPYASRFPSSISRSESEDEETPLAGPTPIGALHEALRVVDTKSVRRSAIDMLLNARSLGQILWLSLHAEEGKGQVRLPRPSSVVGLVQRMHGVHSDPNCLKQAAVLAVIAAICVPATAGRSAAPIALSGALPVQFPDVLKPYALEILKAYDERLPAFLEENKDATDRLEPSAARIDRAFEGYRAQIQRMRQQDSLGPQAVDIGPPPGIVIKAKRKRAQQHENVVAQASPDSGAAGRHVTRDIGLGINQEQVRARNTNLPSPGIPTLSRTDPRSIDWTAIPVPGRSEEQPDLSADKQSFDENLDTFLMDPQQLSVFVNAESLQDRLPAHQFPAAVQRMVSLRKEQGGSEKDPLKIAWLKYLSERSGVADLGDISLADQESQAAFAHVLKDLSKPSRRMATTELALGILMKASGALEPDLYKQISDALREATEWPGSLAPNLPELLNAAIQHPACAPALEGMINRCLLKH